MTARTLTWWTTRYFQRYATSRAHLRRLLRRRIRKREQDPDALSELVEAELDRCERLGLIDDGRYAADKARALHRRGASRRKIYGALAAKGLDSEQIEAALASLSAEGGDPEWEAALTWARKRRLGPWSRERPADRDAERKQLAKLGRAGFSYDIARRVLALEEPP